MCGIAGIFRKDGMEAERTMLQAMTDAMRQRGPDGEGFFFHGSAALGHSRLAVIDPEGGAQPLFNEDRSVAAVHNGEIYNFPELRRELEAKGHVFRTRSDSECIVHLYEEYGTDFPEKLLGMFAIAVLDVKKNSLVLVTDRFGKKPVFYFEDRSLFCFASSIPALAATGIMPDELNLQGIWDYFSMLTVPAPETLYTNVRKLPPATVMVIAPDAEYPDVRTYWSPSFLPKTALSYEDAKQRLRELVTDSVTRRMVSDVPLGVFLSGGLDSAVIAAVASRIPTGGPLQCFSIGFGSRKYDESTLSSLHAAWIRKHAARDLVFHIRQVVPDDFAVLEQLCAEYGEPFADASILPTCLLSRFARENVTVCLCGDGADELFAGYERYLAMRMLKGMNRIPAWIRRFAAQTAAWMFPAGHGERTFGAKLNRFLHASLQDSAMQYYDIMNKFPREKKYAVAGDAFRTLRPDETIRLMHELKRKVTAVDPAEQCMEMDLQGYLADDILVKADTASMSASLEVRSPFLDHRVAEFACSLPMEYKLDGKRRKKILADAFLDMLPPGIGDQKKRGFGVPVAEWFRGPWKERLTERLLDGVCVRKYALLRKEGIETMIRKHLSEREDYGYPLYTMLVLELALEAKEK